MSEEEAARERARAIIRDADIELDWLLHAVETVDRWLDAEVAGAYRDQPLAQDWARVCKGTEEQGESVAELILATGQNPRKGTDPGARDRLLAELADTAVTAVFAIQHFTKDPATTWNAVTRAVAKAYDRAPEEYRVPFPPEPATQVMPFLNGKRFACGKCSATVFSRRGTVYTCNGCGAEYEGSPS